MMMKYSDLVTLTKFCVLVPFMEFHNLVFLMGSCDAVIMEYSDLLPLMKSCVLVPLMEFCDLVLFMGCCYVVPFCL